LTFTTTDSVQGFWFFENILDQNTSANSVWWFQSPRGDFGFLKSIVPQATLTIVVAVFQSPRGDFGFLKR